MKYVHVFSGAKIDVDEGSVHWPWVTPERAEVRDRVARARTSARESVAARIAGTRSTEREAGTTVRRTRRAAASTAEDAVEGSTNG